MARFAFHISPGRANALVGALVAANPVFAVVARFVARAAFERVFVLGWLDLE